MKKIYFAYVAFLMTAMAFSQGVTTSSLGGQVTDNLDEPLFGANIIAIHTPSGTKYGATTDFDGYYRISNMRVGGPYTVTISYVGFNNFERTGVFLNLGETVRISAEMAESSTELDEVVVTASPTGVFDSDKTGASTRINQRDIATVPSASRSIADFVRLTPQAQISEGDDGFSISIAGQNNRYNAIYIDGAVNNDVFGLAGSGTNGGQTGVNPFSVDAIESFQVSVAPFDVKISGFSGGAISAITRSGTNEVEGSAYYFYRSQDLAGKTPVESAGDGERTKLNDFTAQTYGVRIGGPIVKDKLFYFVNYERQNDETPQPFNINNYSGNSSANDLNTLREFLINSYGYDPGSYDNNTRTLESNKLTAKIDWNINDDHKLSLKHSYVGGENLEARTSDNNDIGFINGSEFFKTTTNTTSLELNSRFGNKFSNSFILGYTSVKDDRDPDGSPFPYIDINDGASGSDITVGGERFSTANLLDQNILTLTNNFEIYSGRHTITVGTHNEYSKAKNLFFASNYGNYEYNSLNDFLTGERPNIYQRGYSLISDGVGDTSSGASEFSVFQMGFYVQDEIQFTDNFKFRLGLRLDTPFWEDGSVNEDFNTRTIPLLEAAGKNLQGAEVGKKVSTSSYLSPRAGFNWDVKGDRSTQIRGGIGIFTSRLPLVWPGGTYNNNGVTGGYTFQGSWFTETPLFNPDVNTQPVGAQPGTGEVGGNIDLFAPDFKLPQVLKLNIAVDQKLPIWNLVASADFLWNDNINAIYYENLNVPSPIGNLTGSGDSRPIYSGGDIDSTYDRIILASNTGDGSSYNASFTLRKPFQNGFAGQVSYSYGDSDVIFEGTSSQNSSQWRGIQTVNGKNSRLRVATSDFAQGHRISANASYEFKWNDNLKTTLGVFYEGVNGSPFSYIYGTPNGDYLLNDDSRDNALIYVPANSTDINLVDIVDGDDNVIVPVAEQWSALNGYINNNEYLSSRKGEYVDRNADRGPWSHIVDLKVLQDISMNFGGNKKHTLQLSFDIFNFTNLLNKNWGVLKTVGNFDSVSLIDFEGLEADGTTPQFTFNPSTIDRIEQIDDSGIQSSRWQAQIGVRYIFK
ncbi:TonB-dependent receptor [Zobellia uliginosa]|uniref:TonB-dependent receptor n=1 Tax=Zobellia uliginosa TaxID=143224 RepID=UPI001C070BA4|nr:TonB-dependent receptor [Zobellia uliginosa]MBU2948523.1 carboxypeptidase regulatory-like domain-containing protein [Zobellia uliginosa]